MGPDSEFEAKRTEEEEKRLAGLVEGLGDQEKEKIYQREDLMPYVPLFSEVITSIGAGGHDYLWMSQQQELYTGGLSASPLCVGHHTSSSRLQRGILFSSHCLEKNFKHMLDLWTHIINSPDFTDVSRLSTLIKMSASSLASSLVDSGHQYAISSSAANLDVVSRNHEILFGYSQVRKVK
ncbi:presequence protease, mitochondrial [Elysia marginata]|uniref:Presequence protease, mitochondrial n=1 Tax=Elysia marginata TaxID=1093978 RepID=A0AAV4J293_9GAST|nr:presequence protease, mitochondrial [Elysia marginata]